MNFLEAIKAKKNWKRRGDQFWEKPLPLHDPKHTVHVSVEYLMAEDYEVLDPQPPRLKPVNND